MESVLHVLAHSVCTDVLVACEHTSYQSPTTPLPNPSIFYPHFSSLSRPQAIWAPTLYPSFTPIPHAQHVERTVGAMYTAQHVTAEAAYP